MEQAEKSDDEVRCPRCRGRDIVPSLSRGARDAVMGFFDFIPRRCRACEKRFYVPLGDGESPELLRLRHIEVRPGDLRCPRCFRSDIVPSLPRGAKDAVMNLFRFVPRRCRACKKRFYIRPVPERETAAE